MPSNLRRRRLGNGALVTELPPESSLWPRWVVAVWVAFAEGRRYAEAGAAATAAAEAAGETGWRGLPVTAQDVWAFVRSFQPSAEAVRAVLGPDWKPLAEPAFDLLDKLVAEGSADNATESAKARGLAAAQQILRITHPSAAGRGAGGVLVNVHGNMAVDLGKLLERREPLQPQALTAGVIDAAVVVLDDTQPRKSRSSSQRGEAERRRRRDG